MPYKQSHLLLAYYITYNVSPITSSVSFYLSLYSSNTNVVPGTFPLSIDISILHQVEMMLSMEPSGRLLLSPSRGAASRKGDAEKRNCRGARHGPIDDWWRFPKNMGTLW